MNAEAIVSLAATALVISFGGAVFLANPRSSVGRMWFFFTVLLAAWAFGDFGIHLHDSPAAASSFLALVSIAFTFFPSVFLHFCLVFYGRWPETRVPILVALYLVGAVFAAFALHGYLFKLEYSSLGHAMGHGEGYEYFQAWMILCVATGLALFVVKYTKTQSKPERSQVLHLLLGLAVPALVAIGLDLSALPDAFPAQPVHTVVLCVLGIGVATRALLRMRSLSPTQEVIAGRVLDSAGDFVCVINREGYITFATELFRETLAVPRDRTWGAVHVKDFVVEHERVYDVFTDAQTDTAPRIQELHYRTMTGREFPVSVAMTPMVENSRPRGLILIARDISDRRELARLVEESQEKYRNIVESSLDGFVVIQDSNLAFVNESAVRIFEYRSAEDMLAVSFDDMIAPGSKAFFGGDLQNGTIGQDIFKNYEMKGLTRTGRIIDLEINARIIRWNGKPAVLSSFRDITERKALEREQARWFWEQESLTAIDRQLVTMVDLEELLNLVTRHARAFTRAEFSGVLMVNEEQQSYVWRGVWGNRHVIPETPFPLSDFYGNLVKKGDPVVFSAAQLTADHFPVAVDEGLLTVAAFPFSIKKNLSGIVVIGFRKEHKLKDRELRLLSCLAGKSAIAIANAELYEDLREREQQLEKLTSARVASQEDERRRIAREIHDGLGQMLTAIKFNVEVLEDAIGRGEAEKKLEEIKLLLDNVMAEAREISYDLMPSVLEDFGLSPALQLLCETFSRRMNIAVKFQSHAVSRRFDRSLEVNLYRTVQEALNNIAKHAQAATADVQLLGSDRGTRMIIEDDGKGFNVAEVAREARAEGGIGIVSMRERAVSFGGTLTIESSPGKGTTIVVDIPEAGKVPHG
ncbi:MAG: PAS domain S-box protein [Ignavibacteriales bacterium]|nr:PAS domain S-box protein [Ignavibacteriales bacterium]